MPYKSWVVKKMTKPSLIFDMVWYFWEYHACFFANHVMFLKRTLLFKTDKCTWKLFILNGPYSLTWHRWLGHGTYSRILQKKLCQNFFTNVTWCKRLNTENQLPVVCNFVCSLILQQVMVKCSFPGISLILFK